MLGCKLRNVDDGSLLEEMVVPKSVVEKVNSRLNAVGSENGDDGPLFSRNCPVELEVSFALLLMPNTPSEYNTFFILRIM